MVAFSFVGSIALLASVAAASPFPAEAHDLMARQEQMPGECTDYCSVSAGCVCITRPTNCVATYIVQAGESCGSVVDHFNNFTATDLYKWNPEIGRECFGLRAYVPVCIGVTGYTYPGPVKGGDVATPEELPVPLMYGITKDCTKYGFIDEHGSPTLPTLREANGISKQQWNTWNIPCRDSNEEWSAWAGYWNCIESPLPATDGTCPEESA
ncbi:hypothetical protein GQ43DRAFT_414316 [Delitschia confertaspora ATCC 74209]|uniref:LysM domain-containing protein n=1 Tax=Delitschia confertaspora ATCC 74209 TaxID=1513339 RepID=A0A9P4JPQ6_9PLEO|nr:hypothetical protein GQ43DRAFT_414316 [Delitschia confertaspora ATCC 74209]